MADIQFVHPWNRRHGLHIVIVEAVSGIEREVALACQSSRGDQAAEFGMLLRSRCQRVTAGVQFDRLCLTGQGGLDLLQLLQFVVDNRIVVVLKADSEIGEMDEAKVRTYLKVSKLPVGIILDFGRSDLEIHSVHRK